MFAARLTTTIGAACSVGCLAGIAVRLTVRDHFPILSLVYYCVPPVIAAGLALAASGLFLVTKWRKPARAAAVTGLFCLLWWCHSAYFHNASVPTAGTHKVLFWNVARGEMGWDSLAEEIHRINPPLVALVEAGRGRDKVNQVWQKRFPEYTVTYLGHGLVVISRGEVVSPEDDALPLGQGGRCARVEVTLDGERFTVVLVDVKSNPLMSRREPLEVLTRLVAELGDRPVLVMGDFNTPADSVHLADFRRRFVNAFEAAGTGFYATWPVPLPVLALDQVWANDRVHVERCRLGWSWRSDHRPVITEFSLRNSFNREMTPVGGISGWAAACDDKLVLNQATF